MHRGAGIPQAQASIGNDTSAQPVVADTNINTPITSDQQRAMAMGYGPVDAATASRLVADQTSARQNATFYLQTVAQAYGSLVTPDQLASAINDVNSNSYRAPTLQVVANLQASDGSGALNGHYQNGVASIDAGLVNSAQNGDPVASATLYGTYNEEMAGQAITMLRQYTGKLPGDEGLLVGRSMLEMAANNAGDNQINFNLSLGGTSQNFSTNGASISQAVAQDFSYDRFVEDSQSGGGEDARRTPSTSDIMRQKIIQFALGGGLGTPQMSQSFLDFPYATLSQKSIICNAADVAYAFPLQSVNNRNLKDLTMGMILQSLDSAAGGFSDIKAQMPYNMTTEPPSPLYSRDQPGFQPTASAYQRMLGINGSYTKYDYRIPDMIIPADPYLAPVGLNINADIETKFPGDKQQPGQFDAAFEILDGRRDRFYVLNPVVDCGARPPTPEEVKVFNAEPVNLTNVWQNNQQPQPMPINASPTPVSYGAPSPHIPNSVIYTTAGIGVGAAAYACAVAEPCGVIALVGLGIYKLSQ